MPILNSRMSGNSTIQPDELLELRGALFLGNLLPIERNPDRHVVVEGNVLVDTGARLTCFDQNAANRAGLQVVDSGAISSVTHANHPVPIYSGIIELLGSGTSITCHRAFGANLHQQGIIALIGRDVLRKSILIYNGPDGSYSLTM